MLLAIIPNSLFFALSFKRFICFHLDGRTMLVVPISWRWPF